MSQRFLKPDLAAVELYAAKIGLPATEAQKLYDYYEANGWRVGRNPMKSWEAAVRNWDRRWREYAPVNSKQNGHTNGAAIIVMQKEYERVCEKMRQLRSQYGDMQTWVRSDSELFKQLRARRDELRKTLNITI